jgi:hypothetical protein
MPKECFLRQAQQECPACQHDNAEHHGFENLFKVSLAARVIADGNFGGKGEALIGRQVGFIVRRFACDQNGGQSLRALAGGFLRL